MLLAAEADRKHRNHVSTGTAANRCETGMKRGVKKLAHTNQRLLPRRSFPYGVGDSPKKRDNETHSGNRRRQRHRRVGALQPGKGRLSGGGQRRRRHRPGPNPQSAARSFDSGPHAAETFGSRDLQGSSQGRQPESLADSDSHGQGRRSGPRRRARAGRGRLRHEAVQPARAGRAREGACCAAPSRARRPKKRSKSARCESILPPIA